MKLETYETYPKTTLPTIMTLNESINPPAQKMHCPKKLKNMNSIILILKYDEGSDNNENYLRPRKSINSPPKTGRTVFGMAYTEYKNEYSVYDIPNSASKVTSIDAGLS